MSGITKELDILKQLFENLSDTDKQVFLTSISQKEQITKVIQPKQITNCPHCQSTHFVKNGTKCNNQRYLCRDCKNHSLNKQAQFSITPKKILKSGKNIFIA